MSSSSSALDNHHHHHHHRVGRRSGNNSTGGAGTGGGGGGGCDCRLLPHGTYTLLPAILATMAWVASLSQDGCDYARVEGSIIDSMIAYSSTSNNGNGNGNYNGVDDSTNSSTMSSTSLPYIEAGLTAYRQPIYNPKTQIYEIQYSGSCTSYPTSSSSSIIHLDIYWKLSKAFAFLSLVFGGGGALFLWFSSCFVFGPGTWRWAGYEVLIASLFQCLAFVWFFNTTLCHYNADDDDDDAYASTSTSTSATSTCTLAFGSKSDIFAAICWFISAIAIFCYYPIPKITDMNATVRRLTRGIGVSTTDDDDDEDDDSMIIMNDYDDHHHHEQELPSWTVTTTDVNNTSRDDVASSPKLLRNTRGAAAAGGGGSANAANAAAGGFVDTSVSNAQLPIAGSRINQLSTNAVHEDNNNHNNNLDDGFTTLELT